MATYNLNSSIPSASSLVAGDTLYANYSGSYLSITLPAGTFSLQCYGASGGAGGSRSGGYGGYSTGTLTLSSSTTLYLFVGGQGTSDSSAVSGSYAGGYNGGGASYGGNGGRGAGGGATDIRIGSTSLYARVIVAGGGGGGFYYSSSEYGTGGAGGGTSGGSGAAGTGGSQTAPGSGYDSTNSAWLAAAFGTGGGWSSGSNTVCGGGGGWYGGGSGNAGGGGSGYVYTSSTASNYPSGCLLNSNYYLSNASTATSTWSGNGYINISVSSITQTWNYTTSSISAPTYNKQTTSSITLTQSACKCYSFTPTISGPLVMYGAGTQDNYGYLCSSAPVLNTSGQPTSYLTANDDSARLYNGGVSNTSFGFMYNVTAGTTYYLYIKPYSSTTSSQTITVTYWMAHPDTRIFIKTDSTTWKQITA